MRQIININRDWFFLKSESSLEKAVSLQGTKVTLPHSWNGEDGQDGGGDYLRTTCLYSREFAKPQLQEGEEVYVEFQGVNSE